MSSHEEVRKWIWQYGNYPTFSYDKEKLATLIKWNIQLFISLVNETFKQSLSVLAYGSRVNGEAHALDWQRIPKSFHKNILENCVEIVRIEGKAGTMQEK